MPIQIHPDSFKENCAFCGEPDAKRRSDDEWCEGCAFCNEACEKAYIEFVQSEAEELAKREGEV